MLHKSCRPWIVTFNNAPIEQYYQEIEPLKRGNRYLLNQTMGKRRKANRLSAVNQAKRAKFTPDLDQCSSQPNVALPNSETTFQIQTKDKVDKKVDIIVKDLKNGSFRSLTIWGAGLGVEKTIAVVEELKRNYLKEDIRYSQETSIRYGDNDQPHLEVILTLHSETIQNTTNWRWSPFSNLTHL